MSTATQSASTHAIAADASTVSTPEAYLSIAVQTVNVVGETVAFAPNGHTYVFTNECPGLPISGVQQDHIYQRQTACICGHLARPASMPSVSNAPD